MAWDDPQLRAACRPPRPPLRASTRSRSSSAPCSRARRPESPSPRTTPQDRPPAADGVRRHALVWMADGKPPVGSGGAHEEVGHWVAVAGWGRRGATVEGCWDEGEGQGAGERGGRDRGAGWFGGPLGHSPVLVYLGQLIRTPTTILTRTATDGETDVRAAPRRRGWKRRGPAVAADSATGWGRRRQGLPALVRRGWAS